VRHFEQRLDAMDGKAMIVCGPCPLLHGLCRDRPKSVNLWVGRKGETVL
jgi:hypothetical protein